MKEFTYIGEYSLLPDACEWLTNMGLHETRWILDADWIIFSYEITYHQWMKISE